MLQWLKAISRETAPAAFSVLSALSTLTTFFIPKLAGSPRAALAICALVGFGWANLRAYKNQRQRIEDLEAKLAAQLPKREAQLLIHPGNSCYYTLASPEPSRTPFRGILLAFHIAVENKGLRQSTIHRYSVNLPMFRRDFSEVRPYFKQTLQTRSFVTVLDPKFALPEGDYIRVPSEGMTKRAHLWLMLEGLSPDDAKGGFLTDPGTRRFPDLKCVLTLTDTEGYSASHEFMLQEGA